ncbi:hypothetical protein CJ030_MR5G010139 [Morella rubra]|uniref:Uncharacterized protein n=1 Tax=Morella rubra TaxID=262757 RepID=A0A6A1VIW4_9ROSI|nr:hypothetical protein CJ030_MR5G010139 [Morella rubra]
MEKWSAGFYFGCDMLVEVVKEKFLGVDLSGFKAEDYTDQASGEVGSPMFEEMLDVEVGGAILEVVVEEWETSGVVPVPMSVNSPSLILEISLANPVVVDASLASINQALLSLMMISGGAPED